MVLKVKPADMKPDKMSVDDGDGGAQSRKRPDVLITDHFARDERNKVKASHVTKSQKDRHCSRARNCTRSRSRRHSRSRKKSTIRKRCANCPRTSSCTRSKS